MRRNKKFKRNFEPDMVHNRIEFTRFINYLMERGKKSVAEGIFYKTLDIIKETTKKDPALVVETAMKNVSPVVEVRSKRVGGANYQVPQEVRPERKFALTCRWILDAARKRTGMDMSKKLAEEFLAAANNEGAAIKKKLDTHRIAEANKAFAHFAR
ncbi:MAG TPA: 30S ribosomal protein S7 [Candidatus Paceibacterota bacterium]|jgi:small subunit ribosomal protein S7|nr:30S ribosomal protein S7 [Candidatus Paceibacterota bacterium]HPT40021.1 30S ribosomal protein S7 [Candidatus Paceibacterota bacterium]